MRIVLIANPFASRVSEERLRAVEHVLASAGEVDTVLTERRGHASELARDARADAIVVYSGDGVFNEVLNGVTGDTPLGLVPGGHANVLVRALGLPEDPLAVAERIAAALVERRARRISLGRVNGRRFAFGAGIGIDAELVRRIEELGPRAKGKVRGDLLFTWEGAKLLARRRGRFTEVLEVEGLGRAAFVLVSNGNPYTFAGPLPLRVHPEADFEHGLDLLAPRETRARTWPRYVAYVLRGKGQERAADILYGHDLDRIVVRCDGPLPLQADGEDLGDVTEAVFEAERGAVAVLV